MSDLPAASRDEIDKDYPHYLSTLACMLFLGLEGIAVVCNVIML